MSDKAFKEFEIFFNKMFKVPKKCIVSKECIDIGDEFIPLVTRENSLKSYAKAEGLNKSDVTCHLARYMENLTPELLIKIEEWDGVDYIGELCRHVKLKDCNHEYFENYIKYWGSRIFARLKNPEHQNTFIILKGKQGIGKDRFVKNLIRGFGMYYSKFTVQPNKEIDTIHQIASNLVLHLEEFDQSHKLSMAFLKEIITCEEKTYRLPYDRAAMRRKMYASFISTVNLDDIFRDNTGNRRFSVFEVDKIDWSYKKDASAQIVAQFKALFDANYQLSKEAMAHMESKITSMTPEDDIDEILNFWSDRVGKLVLKGQSSSLDLDTVAPVIESIVKMTRWSTKRVFSILKQHGFSSKQGGNIRYFPTRSIKTEEISKNQ